MDNAAEKNETADKIADPQKKHEHELYDFQKNLSILLKNSKLDAHEKIGLLEIYKHMVASNALYPILFEQNKANMQSHMEEVWDVFLKTIKEDPEFYDMIEGKMKKLEQIAEERCGQNERTNEKNKQNSTAQDNHLTE